MLSLCVAQKIGSWGERISINLSTYLEKKLHIINITGWLMLSKHLFTYLFIHSPIASLKTCSVGKVFFYSPELKFGKSYNFCANS